MSRPFPATDSCELEQVPILPPLTVPADALLSQAIAQINRHAQNGSSYETYPSDRSILVVENARLIGILTPLQILTAIANHADWQKLVVSEILSGEIVAIRAGEFNGLTALKLMQAEEIIELPVLRDDGTIVGIISLPQLLGALHSDPTRAFLEPAETPRKTDEIKEIKFSWAEILSRNCLQSQPDLVRQCYAEELDAQLRQRTAQLRAQIEQAQLLATVAQRIRSSLELEEILDAAMTGAKLLLGADRVLVYQFDPDMSGTIVAESVESQWLPLLNAKIEDSFFKTSAADKFRRGCKRAVANVERVQLSDCHRRLLRAFQAQAYLVVSINIGSQLWGLLVAHQCSGPRDWQPHDLELLDQLAVQLAIAIQQARAFEQVQRELKERQQIEASLRRAYQQLTFHVENTPLAALEWDWQLRVQRWSGQAESIFGWRASEVLGKAWTEWPLVWEEDLPQLQAAAQRLLNGSEPRNLCQARTYTKTGEIRYCEWYNSVLRDETAQVISVLSLVQDVSDRHQAEQKIREQAALLDVATDAIMVCDASDRITYWNHGAERLYGWSAVEAIGQKVTQLIKQTLPEPAAQIWQSLTAQGKWQGELEQVTRAGKTAIVESRWALVQENRSAPSVLIVNTDITERKQLESQFLRAQRLESIGTLASGIAHDLNNILTPILAGTQLLQRRVPQSDRHAQELLEIVEMNVHRGAALVKQVLSFSRGMAGKRTALPLQPLIAEVTQIIRETFPKAIALVSNMAPDLWLIRGDGTQLHQVLMNLCVNGRDAMPEGGQLTIKAENCFINQQDAQQELEARVGPYVKISVRDTGVGIPAEQLERIFEPFFTTKEPGKGTGLGLSTVLGIVKSHGGFVWVKSTVAQGSEFQVFLPAMPRSATPAIAPKQELSQGQGELILVVDDEINVTQMAAATLKSFGYRAMVAHSGQEAIALYQEHQGEIAAVVMDNMMPGISGVTAMRALRQLDAQVKIVAVSGLYGKQQMTAMSEAGVIAFLSKPYSAEALLQAIAKALT